MYASINFRRALLGPGIAKLRGGRSANFNGWQCLKGLILPDTSNSGALAKKLVRTPFEPIEEGTMAKVNSPDLTLSVNSPK